MEKLNRPEPGEIIGHTLYIKIKPNSVDTLIGFPFREGQYLDGEQAQADGGTLLLVAFGDARDTTGAQEEFLNTSPSVVTYWVSEDIAW